MFRCRLETPGVEFLIHIQKNILVVFYIAVALGLITPAVGAEENGTIGFTPYGNYGVRRLLMPMAPSTHLSVSGYAGYGLIESMGPVSGAHHRIDGLLSVAGSPIKQLGMRLSLDGYHDRHPSDDTGGDTTTVGTPSFGIHGGQQIGKWIQLGGALDVIIPGGAAPSLAFESTTLEPRLILAVAPQNEIWRLIASVGYRWDNTGKTAPEAQSLRPGDRISIGTSDYDAVLVGLGSSVSISKVELLAELTSNIYVNNPPSGSSPVRIDVGARYHITPALQAALITETLLIGRPELDADTPIMPIEPRFSISVGVTYAFGVKKQTVAPTDEENPIAPIEPPTTKPEAPTAETTSIEGSVVDEEGNPIGGTSVRFVTAAEGEPEKFETTTDQNGQYRLTDLPLGEGTLVIEMEGFDPIEQPMTLSSEPVLQEPSILREVISSPTQLRGQIRSIKGEPLKAKLVIKPGNKTVETDEDGQFSIDLPSGKYRVTISAPGRKSQKKRVVIEENSVTIINVDLR